MSLVVLENGGLGFGGRTIFSSLALRVGEEDRVGVVGRNGSGKSSLLKIIAARQELGSGTLRYARGTRVGYLPQEIEAPPSGTLIDAVLASVPGREGIEQMLESVEGELGQGGDDETLMGLSQKLADLHEELGRFETMFSRHEALSILAGLGFREADLSRGIERLSGGWRMRAVLASLLFQRPDLLLLDEPTNHLDVPTVAWLAEFMKSHHGALMLICHDREFLNEQVARIVSFEPEGVRQYKGNYEQYRVARAEELEVLDRRATNIAREREQAERFIRRFRAQASRARAVQSRVKALEKLDDVARPNDQASLAFKFPPSKRPGLDVIRMEAVSQDYGQGEIFTPLTTLIRRGERVALVGANGNGKSTLLRIMAGALVPSTGRCIHGHNVEVGYYAQHVAERLDLDRSILEEVWSESVVHEISRVRSALGTMMFSGDDVDKKIGVLSGGEKARVALARLLVRPGNVILMDEPTNHLDLESSEALAEALAGFDGTLLFASHNRSFVNRLATRILDVEAGRVADYPGTLTEYMERCARLAHASSDDEKPKAAPVAVPVVSKPAVRSRDEDKKRRALRRDAERRVSDYERRIAELEAAQSERSAVLSQPETYADAKLYQRLLGEYQGDTRKLEELLGRWENAQAELAGLDEASE